VGVALQHQWSFLAVLAVLAMAISVIALSRLAYGLMGDLRALPSQPASVDSRPRRIFLGALFIPMFLLGIFAEPLLAWVTRSIRFILW
jgi:NADH:ubiquinone oxidoreductase subunit 2 (subunit N)